MKKSISPIYFIVFGIFVFVGLSVKRIERSYDNEKLKLAKEAYAQGYSDAYAVNGIKITQSALDSIIKLKDFELEGTKLSK